jgi:hypothetical protein
VDKADIRLLGIRALEVLGDKAKAALPVLQQRANADENHRVRAAAVAAIGKITGEM